MNFIKILSATLVFSAVMVLQTAMATLPLAVDGQRLPSLAPIVERVSASLVRVSATASVPEPRDPFFRRFFDQRRPSNHQKREVFSTGVVIDGSLGLILINEHSVRGNSSVRVTLADGRVFDGDVLGADPASDVALVKVNATDLLAISLADSDSLRVGDFVISIGSPLGDENTLVTGVVSALARNNSVQAHQNFIRSDAAVGPGVLINLNGEMVGLNIAKSAKTSGNLRIGFSTPMAMALRVKRHLLEHGSPQRGFLAVQVQDLTPDLAKAFEISQAGGAVISNVIEGSTADQAGLKIGDVILDAGSQKITRSNDLRAIIGQQFAGDTLSMTVVREGGKVELMPVLDSSTRVSKRGTMIHHQLEGAVFKESDTQAVSASVDDGLTVSQVRQGSVAWEHGVRANDVIVSANRKSVNNVDSLRKAIEGKEVLMLNIVRGNGSMFLLLQ